MGYSPILRMAPSQDPAMPDTDAETLHRLARARFTCRAYRPEPVPEATIRAILDTARHAASWCNTQPWHLVIASPAATQAFRQALMAEAERQPEARPDVPFPPGYAGVHKQRRQEAGHALFAALGIARDDHAAREAQSAQNFRLFAAPQVAIVTVPTDLGPYAIADCGAFVGAFLLAARAQGVATTPQAALARHSGFIRQHFAIPEGEKVLCGIAFGYADPGHPANGFRTSRAPAEELARFV